MSKLVSALALLALLATPLAAQQGRGSIQGIVADGSGAAIAGANVTVIQRRIS